MLNSKVCFYTYDKDIKLFFCCLHKDMTNSCSIRIPIEITKVKIAVNKITRKQSN